MSQPKKLNTFNIFTMAFGGIIGAGIFVMMGLALSFTGYSLPLAAIVGMIYVNLTTLYALIIVSFIPLKGGIYGQYSLTLPPVLVGVMSVTSVIGGFSYSGFGTGIADYLGSVFPAIVPFRKPLAIIIIALAFLLTTREIKLLGKVQNAMTVILILALFLFIGVGVTHVDFSVFNPSNEGFFLNGLNGFVSATAMLGFACNGAIVVTTFAPDTENPRHTIPKGALLAIVAVGIVYVLMAIVSVGVLPIEQVAGQSLAVVAQAIFSTPMFVIFIIGGAVFALATSLLSGVASLPYILSAIAHDGWLPKVLNKTTEKGYPTRLVLINFAFSIIPILFDISFDNVISMISLPSIPLMLMMTLACFSFPKKYPELWKTSFFHMPYPLYAALLGLCTLAAAYYMISYLITLSPQYYLMAGIIAAALYGISYFRLKTGAVDKQQFIDNKEAIIAEILAEEKNAVEQAGV